MSDIKNETEDSVKKQLIQKCLTQSAVAFTAQINEDKLAVMDALALIKKSSEFDVISERQFEKANGELKTSIEYYKSTAESADPESTRQSPDPVLANKLLQDIFESAEALSTHVRTLQLMVHLGIFLLENNQVGSAVSRVRACVLHINAQLAQVSNTTADAEISDLLCPIGRQTIR